MFLTLLLVLYSISLFYVLLIVKHLKKKVRYTEALAGTNCNRINKLDNERQLQGRQIEALQGIKHRTIKTIHERLARLERKPQKSY